MIYSKGSVVVGHQRPHDGRAGGVVVPDGGGQGEDPLQDPDGDAVVGPAAVLFEVELALEGVVDRLDGLAQWLEVPAAGGFGLACGPAGAGRARRRRGLLEVSAVYPLSPMMTWPGRQRSGRPRRGCRAAPTARRPSGRPGRIRLAARQGGDQVQPQPPEPARMAGAVPVLGQAAQVAAFDGLTGTGALDRGRVHQPDVVGPQAGAGGQHPGAVPDQAAGRAQPLVVAGLVRQVGEEVTQVRLGIAEKAGLGGEPQQGLQTARVTSSASLSLGAMPTAVVSGAAGDSFSRSSAMTYSAVARVSRLFVTKRSWAPSPHIPGLLGLTRLGVVAAGSWAGCRFAASPKPSPAALPFLSRMHHADCAHVAGGTEPHDGKARNWRLEGGIDRAAPPHRPDLEAAGNDHGDCPHVGVDDNLDVPVIELGLAQINRHAAHACVDLGETAHLPAALETNLAHRGRDLERLLTPPCGRSEFDGACRLRTTEAKPAWVWAPSNASRDA